MTSDEIKANSAIDMSTNSWLREICYQLALMNEGRFPVAEAVPVAPVPEKRGPGRPPKSKAN